MQQLLLDERVECSACLVGMRKPLRGWKSCRQGLDTSAQVCIIVFQQLHHLDLAGIVRWASGSAEAGSLRRYPVAACFAWVSRPLQPLIFARGEHDVGILVPLRPLFDHCL